MISMLDLNLFFDDQCVSSNGRVPLATVYRDFIRWLPRDKRVGVDNYFMHLVNAQTRFPLEIREDGLITGLLYCAIPREQAEMGSS